MVPWKSKTKQRTCERIINLLLSATTPGVEVFLSGICDEHPHNNRYILVTWFKKLEYGSGNVGWAGVNEIWTTYLQFVPDSDISHPPPTKKRATVPFLPFILCCLPLHPWKLTPGSCKSKRNLICQGWISRLNVSFRGCKCENGRAQFGFWLRYFLSVSCWRSSSWRWWCGGRLEMKTDPQSVFL